MLFTEITNAAELKEHLWEKLNLANRAITFHVVNFSDGDQIIGSGIMASIEDDFDSEAIADYGCDNDGCPEIEIDSIESWMLGNGESDHADHEDVILLERAMCNKPDLLDEVLRQEADSVASIGACTIDNYWFIDLDEVED